MGLGFLTRAAVPSGGFFRRSPSREALFDNIVKEVTRSINEPCMKHFMQWGTDENVLWFHLHPAAEYLYFTWKPSGTITVELKTSTVGPGFHAFAVDLVNTVGKKCRLNWEWLPDSEEEGPDDETSYANTGDFASLQHEMCKLMKTIGRRITEENFDPTGNVLLNVPFNSPNPLHDFYCLAPQGPLPRNWWGCLLDEPDCSNIAKDYYPWLEHGFNARYYQGIALTLLWWDVQWRPYVNEREKLFNRLALDAMNISREMDPAITYPQEVLTELEHVHSLPGDQKYTPRAGGIGVNRYVCKMRGIGNWGLNVPGWFIQDHDEETMLYYYFDKSIRLSSISIQPPDGSTIPAAEVAERFALDKDQESEIIHFKREHLIGDAQIFRKTGEEEYWMLQGGVAADGTYAYTSICYDDESSRDWAVSVFESISHPSS